MIKSVKEKNDKRFVTVICKNEKLGIQDKESMGELTNEYSVCELLNEYDKKVKTLENELNEYDEKVKILENDVETAKRILDNNEGTMLLMHMELSKCRKVKGCLWSIKQNFEHIMELLSDE